MSEKTKGFVVLGAMGVALLAGLVWLIRVELDKGVGLALADWLLALVGGSLVIFGAWGLARLLTGFAARMVHPAGESRRRIAVESFNRAEEGFISLLLVAMVLLVVIEVIMRFVLDAGRIWVQELTLHTNAWMVLFGAAYGVRVGSHIGVDAVVRLLSPFTRRIVTGVAVALCLVYCGLFGYGAWIYLAKIYSIGLSMEDLRIPVAVAEHIPVWLAEPIKLNVEDLYASIEAGLEREYLEAPQWPVWLAHSVLILGFVLLGIRFVELAWALVRGTTTDFNVVDEAKSALDQVRKEHEQAGDAGDSGAEQARP